MKNNKSQETKEMLDIPSDLKGESMSKGVIEMYSEKITLKKEKAEKLVSCEEI